MKKIKLIIILSFTYLFTSQILLSENILDNFKFVKQGFCNEIKNRKEKDFPYLIKCKKDGVFGLRKETISINGANYFIIKNFLNEKLKYIGPLTAVDKIEGFDFNKEILFISFGQKQYIFNLDTLNTDDTIKIIKYHSRKSYYFYYINKNINVFNNFIYLNYSYPGMVAFGDKSTTSIRQIDFENKEINKIYFPIPLGEYYGVSSPSNVIALNKENIAISDRSQYNIYFYDYSFNKIDSIKRKWKNEDRIPKEEILHFEKNIDYKSIKPNEIIMHLLQNKWDELCNHIRKINYLNDSTLLISYNVPVEDTVVNSNTSLKFLYDIIQKRDGRWEIYKEGLKDHNITQTKMINKMSQSLYADYETGGDYIFIHNSVPFILENDLEYEQYIKKENEYYLEKSNPYGYFIYRFDK